MNKLVAQKLDAKAAEIAREFSDPDRAYNHCRETFDTWEICPLSEMSAAIVYTKSSGKQAAAFCYYLKQPQDGYWQFYFPKESHVMGMVKMGRILSAVEAHNFPLNQKD